MGIELTPSTSYHPQTDGKTKIVKKWLEGYLRNYVTGQQHAWVTWLHFEKYCYNTTYHMSISMSTFLNLYEYDALSFVGLFLEKVGPQGPNIGYKRANISINLSRIICKHPKINRRCM